MPETVKREYTAQSNPPSFEHQKRDGKKFAEKYPAKPQSSDGKFEGTVDAKKRRSSF